MRKTVSLLLLVLLLITACEKYDVAQITEGDEIIRLVNDSEDGQELFRTDGLFKYVSTINYPGNDTTYTDIIDSVRRSITIVKLSSNTLVNTGFGEYFFAEIDVLDKFYGSRTKTVGSPIDTAPFDKKILRSAFLIKIGDDSRPYSGWRIYGINYGVHEFFDNARDNNNLAIHYGLDKRLVYPFETYHNDGSVDTSLDVIDYFPVDSISVIPKNSPVSYIVEIDTMNWLVYTGHESDQGYEVSPVTNQMLASQFYTDTLLTPSNSSKLWHLISVTGINQRVDSLGLFLDYYTWFIPYKISN